MNKKSILKVVSLLSVGSIVMLSATSCNGIKLSEQLKSSNLDKQPQPDPTLDKNPTNEHMVDDGVSALVTKARTELDNLIKTKADKLDAYSDYSVIKNELTSAYNAAELTKNSNSATEQQLNEAKASLQSSINKAEADKTEFDNGHTDIVRAYNELKTTLNNKSAILSSLNDDKYVGIRSYFKTYYDTAEQIITNTLQYDGLTKNTIDQAKNKIVELTDNLDSKKSNIDQYSTFKMFRVNNTNFKGSLKYSATPADSQKLVTFSSDFDNDNNSYQWRYANRLIDSETKERSIQITNVSWIYSLDTQDGMNMTTASYDLDFEYYGGNTATLYFPYKAAKADQVSGSNLSLKYKLNENNPVNVDLTGVAVNDIKVATINLTGLKFGMNKISFTTEANKKAPMIGNFYISTTNDTVDAVYNDIFGNEVSADNPDKITVNFLKGYGLANKGYGVVVRNTPNNTFIKKMNFKLDSDTLGNNVPTKEYYIIGYLGGTDGSSGVVNGSNVKYYTFYLNAPKDGMYEIGGVFNSGGSRGLSFWKGSYNASGNGNKAKFQNLNSGDWNSKLKSFNKNQKATNESASLQLTKGLNKIIVSGSDSNSPAPNLGNVSFTLVNNSESNSR
ncbi:hypothetical protein [Mycoplasma bradburyae]|uniref:Haemagglutinin Mycoplasma domain-containing protein n=1 Tax=Mycoplasma bradburyae TaxID=2963128 RepID=A0ABT5GAU5_9MOLU|nr:hypothetical protein [Mycoplasma bradburyae]MDC4182096.1 hypothetical protein [Mycoplasma bradburyae]UTS69830.1 hypothetical protein NMG68_02270 [Mycoplasma bradburyae]